ncbi:MAG: hypothetical protein ACRDIC_10950 [bacterium]
MSGGGIRSAAFNLGALQALQANGVLERTSYLAAVSGGNYIASALTIAAAHSDPPTEDAKPLWGTGSPEERYLRQHTDYLAPGYTGTLWMGSSMVYGFLLNYLPFMLCMMIAGRVIGWLLFAAQVRLSDLRLNGLALPRSPLLVSLVVIGFTCVLAALWLVAFRRLFKEDKPGNFGESRSERWSAGFLMAAGAIAVLIALPALADLYGRTSLLVLTKVFGEPETTFETFAGRAFAVTFWLVISLVMASAALVLGRRFRALRLMLTLSFVASAGLLLVPLLSALEFSTRHGLDSVWDIVGVAGGGLFVLLMAVAIHNRRYSMHNVYRERLSSAFALHRKNASEAEPLNYEKRLYFSRTAPREGHRVPELVVCCAVNLTTDDVPVGRFAESFTFERGRTGGALFGYTTTSAIENDKGVAGTQLTLPSIMAVSGAALSPLMGRHTYPPLRFLMALTNIRLGVWIKNPNHERWNHLFADATDTAESDHTPPGNPTALRRLLTWARDGWHEPGALYVLREALGAASSTRRYIYLTDGGHWENLGLVELLRRRCTHVLCFDASYDAKGLGLDVGRAIALARSDLNAQVDLDPRSVLPGTDGFSEAMAVDGAVVYPTGESANLVYAKAVLTKDASWDLHAFNARDSRFPNHSTTQQTFTDEQFEAYRKLGYDAGLEALVKLRLPGLVPVSAFGNGHRR